MTEHAPAAVHLAVEMRGITKSFPGVVANDGVNLAVRRGEVHCLLGENGAGKSTLMAILAGMLTPDAGQIVRDGVAVRVDTPRRARDLGIGMVPQHAVLVPGLSVLENVMLGESSGLRLRRAAALARFHELSDLLGVDLDPRAPAGGLALGQQQQVAIVKALWPGARLLILDEPTALLGPRDVDNLQSGLARLKREGVAVIFITHKLHEALGMGDRITILRGGRVVATLDAAALHAQAPGAVEQLIVGLMFGPEAVAAGSVIQPGPAGGGPAALASPPRQPLLELAGLSARGEGGATGVHSIWLAVARGEILGIAGVEGNGQRVLADAIAGQQPLTAGDLRLEGRSIARLSVAARQRLGLGYVTDDRLGEGIVSSLSVALNLLLKRIGQAPYWRWGRIQPGPITRAAQDLVAHFDVRTPSVTARISTLSGGNIQKVLLARDLSFDPRVVVYHNPTQGLDVRTAGWIRERIRAQAVSGVAAIIISPDLTELLALCDRIAVLSRGRLAGTVENGAVAAARVGALMVGEPMAAQGGGTR